MQGIVAGRVTIDNRDHHRDLLPAGGFEQRPFSGFAHVGRLCPQHVGQRRSPLDRHDQPVDEPRERLDVRTVRDLLQRLHQRQAGAGAGQRVAEIPGQRAAGQPAHPLDRAGRSLARGDGQRKEFGDDGKLREHRLFVPGDLRGQPPVAPEHTAEHAAGAEQQRRHDVQLGGRDRDQCGEDHAEAESERAPEHLLDAEVLDAVAIAQGRQPPAHRAATARQPVEDPDRIAQHGSQQAPHRGEDADRPRGLAGEQARGRRAVAQVRREPVVEADRPHRRRRVDREQQPARGEDAEQRAGQRRAHRSTRRSRGSRPIHTIRRYATTQTAPPTARISAPVALS